MVEQVSIEKLLLTVFNCFYLEITLIEIELLQGKYNFEVWMCESQIPHLIISTTDL